MMRVVNEVGRRPPAADTAVGAQLHQLVERIDALGQARSSTQESSASVDDKDMLVMRGLYGDAARIDVKCVVTQALEG